jgi:alcohol dehydrogenase class IV
MDALLRYDFLVPQKIVFGWGRRSEVGRLGRLLGRRAFLVSGLPDDLGKPILDEIRDRLLAESIEARHLATLAHEPQVADVDQVAKTLCESNINEGDFLVAVGGGAAIDLAKAVAGMAVSEESDTVKDYLENVGRDLKLVKNPLPLLAIPTTAGTGAEATKNAVISSYDPPFKKSFRDDRLMPRIALIDPELTLSVPPSVSAASGMDAVTHLLESYVSLKAKPIPQSLAVQGLKLAIPALPEVIENPASRSAREAMSHAALLGGIALANSGLGMAHGVAAALGVHCRVPHGLACAVMLPVTLRANRNACLKQFAELAQAVFGSSAPSNTSEAADFFLDQIDTLCTRLKIPRHLQELGVRHDQLPAIVRDSQGSSMSGNPRAIADNELIEILERIF